MVERVAAPLVEPPEVDPAAVPVVDPALVDGFDPADPVGEVVAVEPLPDNTVVVVAPFTPIPLV
jgi:hypothetical protein